MGRAIMVQGTASHVGKSVLVAGLCRWFQREGLRVAPFKAQNMALNSFVTPDGGEIGRAQAAQAEAARVAPAVEMNPILLKPEGNSRSQVVVKGRVLTSMDAAEYHRRVPELWPVVEASLNQLVETFDLVVIEGAGSPVEMNLLESDIVNMRVARAVGAPVLLVADIERGGVFAALVGTMELLEPELRELIAGFVVNKFRGDPALFAGGITYLQERLRRPVLGVVPWIPDLAIAQEDSLGLPRSGSDPDAPGAPGASVDVAVIRFPRIANFDDLEPLQRRPGVRVRYVERLEDFGRPDLAILPGTKTTRADLAFMRERSLDLAVIAHVRRGGAVLGICGGYQMLGRRIDDPDGVEDAPGGEDGLGLLPVDSRYAREKETRQVRGSLVADRGPLAAHRREIAAYEIHMGRTAGSCAPFARIVTADGARFDGAVSPDGLVVGTYLHGLFHNPSVVAALVDWFSGRKGFDPPETPPEVDAYDRLADTLSGTLDVGRLRMIAGVTGPVGSA